MQKDYIGVLTLTENELDIRGLTYNRPLASIPIGGRYRIIDFALSNMVNSGIQGISVFTESNSRSLVEHLGTGKPWDLDRNTNGLFVFNFNISGSRNSDVKMINSNMEYFVKSKQNNVILSSSYMICKVDYDEAIKNHEQSGKEITVIYKKVDNARKEMLNCDTLYLEDNVVKGIGRNIGGESEANISMEMFILKKEKLIEFMRRSMQRGYNDTFKDMIYDYAKLHEINAYEFKGYLKCVNSTRNYFNTNMDMLNTEVVDELFYKNGRVLTKVKNDPPTKYLKYAQVDNSLISNGCIINGNVENSVLSRQVMVKKGAVIRDSIIFQGCVIEEDCTLINVILDKGVIIKKDAFLKGTREFPIVIEKNSIINP